jgi:hypothetical protein
MIDMTGGVSRCNHLENGTEITGIWETSRSRGSIRMKRGKGEVMCRLLNDTGE